MKRNDERDADLEPIRDSADWGEARNDGVVTRNLGTTISVRLSPDDARKLRRAARIRQLSQSEFVRRASIAEAQSVLGASVLHVRSRGTTAVISIEDNTVRVDTAIESHAHVLDICDIAAD
jgi:uncharacterized protein (DUF1778 family)